MGHGLGVRQPHICHKYQACGCTERRAIDTWIWCTVQFFFQLPKMTQGGRARDFPSLRSRLYIIYYKAFTHVRTPTRQPHFPLSMSELWGGRSAQSGSICPNVGTGLRPENMNYVRTAGRPLWGFSRVLFRPTDEGKTGKVRSNSDNRSGAYIMTRLRCVRAFSETLLFSICSRHLNMAATRLRPFYLVPHSAEEDEEDYNPFCAL